MAAEPEKSSRKHVGKSPDFSACGHNQHRADTGRSGSTGYEGHRAGGSTPVP